MKLTKSNFDTEIENNKVSLVDFWAAWCGPCRALTPTIEELEKEFSDTAVVAKVNVDEEPQLNSIMNGHVMDRGERIVRSVANSETNKQESVVLGQG